MQGELYDEERRPVLAPQAFGLRIAEAVTANRKRLSSSNLAQLGAIVVNQKLTALTYSGHRYPACTTPTLADFLELSPATRVDFAARREQLLSPSTS